MFGSIAPVKDELRVRELAQYQAYYCGLCREISRGYGQPPRIALNYDCTFIAMLLAGLNGEAEFRAEYCAFKPLKKRRPVAQSSDSLTFSADLSVVLFWHKLLDDKMDERKALAAAANALLLPAKRRAQKRNPQLCEVVERGMQALLALEREHCAEVDAAADAFGVMMWDCAQLAPLKDEKMRAPLRALAYNTAKWTYFADAWQDRERDEKSGAYNPFLVSGASVERAAFLLRYSLGAAMDAFELLDAGENSGVLENILYIGLGEQTNALLGGVDERSV